MLSDLTTLIVGYVLYFICFFLIAIRLAATWSRNKKWDVDDYWMLAASAILILRVAVIHLVLVYNTNNVDHPELLTSSEISRREFGSKMALVGRSCYATFIWCMKFCILALYARIVEQLDEYRRFIKYIWAFQFLTLVGVMLSTLLECHPFDHYWQVFPNPGHACTFAEAQLYTTGACNIATDLALIVYPIPIVFRTRLPLKLKIHLYSLFSLGFFVILVSIFRLPFVVQNNAIQQWRTLFASIEMLAACCVANAPVLYRLIADQSQKLQASAQTRARQSTGASSSSPSSSAAARYWFSVNRTSRRAPIAGSGVDIDEIEFAGLGMGREAQVEASRPRSRSGSRKNLAGAGAEAEIWGLREEEEGGAGWGTDESTTVDSDRMGSFVGGKGSHDQERQQPV